MTQLPTQVEGSIFQMEWGYFNSFERGTSVRVLSAIKGFSPTTQILI